MGLFGDWRDKLTLPPLPELWSKSDVIRFGRSCFVAPRHAREFLLTTWLGKGLVSFDFLHPDRP